MHLITKFFAAAMLVVAGTPALAQTQVTSAAFLPSDTVVTFTGVPDESAVGSSFSASGVTFSGALFGMTNSGDTSLFPSGGGGVIASNWLYDGGGLQGLSFTADFSSQVNRVGFWLENHQNQTMAVQLFNGLTLVGALPFSQTSSLTAEFRGLESATSFNRAVFTNTATSNGFFAIDNFTFGSSAVAAVPEPATWAMMLIGFGGMGVALRRRRRTASSLLQLA